MQTCSNIKHLVNFSHNLIFILWSPYCAVDVCFTIMSHLSVTSSPKYSPFESRGLLDLIVLLSFTKVINYS